MLEAASDEAAGYGKIYKQDLEAESTVSESVGRYASGDEQERALYAKGCGALPVVHG